MKRILILGVNSMMPVLARFCPECRDAAARVTLVETTADDYYGKRYQDVRQPVPRIANICADLGREPKVRIADALRCLVDAHRIRVADGRALAE